MRLSKLVFSPRLSHILPSGLALRHEWKVAPTAPEDAQNLQSDCVEGKKRNRIIKLFDASGTHKFLERASPEIVIIRKLRGKRCRRTIFVPRTLALLYVVGMWIPLTQVSTRVTSLAGADRFRPLLFPNSLTEPTSSHSIKIKRRAKFVHFIHEGRKWKVFRRQKPRGKTSED